MKIANFEITDNTLIEYAAKKGKPMAISMGTVMKEDIELSVKIIKMLVLLPSNMFNQFVLVMVRFDNNKSVLL